MDSIKPLFTAVGSVTGGRNGHGEAEDHSVSVDLSVPKAMGGPGRPNTTTPEHLFAVGYAACFESALTTVARRRQEQADDVAIDSMVMLVAGEDRGFNIAVELDVSLPSIDDPAKAVDLVRAAHKVCPYSNATRGNIEVGLTANGQPVD